MSFASKTCFYLKVVHKYRAFWGVSHSLHELHAMEEFIYFTNRSLNSHSCHHMKVCIFIQKHLSKSNYISVKGGSDEQDVQILNDATDLAVKGQRPVCTKLTLYCSFETEKVELHLK